MAFGARGQTLKCRVGLGKEINRHVSLCVGPRKDMGDCPEIVEMNRILRWYVGKTGESDRIEMEADARHVHILAQQTDSDSKGRQVVSPGIRSVEQRGDELDESRRATYTSAAMTLTYLSQD